MNTNCGGIKDMVSVIIPTYNRAYSIGKTLDSFFELDYPSEKYEIIVCDNNSSDNTREVIEQYIQKYGQKRIRYIFEKRQGAHYARNTGAKNAQGDILYFTDDDMIAHPKMLKNLLKVFEQDENVAVATGRIMPKWLSIPPRWVEQYCCNLKLSLNDLGVGTIISNKDMGVYSCHQAIRRDVFNKTNGFHFDYVGGELLGDGESGLNQDIIEMGYKLAYVGSSYIFHMIPENRMTQKYINKHYHNQANCVSYQEYRRSPFGKQELYSRICSYIFRFLYESVVLFYVGLRKRTTFRFIPATFMYYRARIRYDYKIIHDDQWRAMVLQSNWKDETND